MRFLLPLSLCLGFSALAAPEGEKPAEAPKPPDAAKTEPAAEKSSAPLVRESSILIAGKKIPYKVTPRENPD
jgi:hypothetical protein